VGRDTVAASVSRPAPAVEELGPEPAPDPALGTRILSRRTLISIGVALVIVVVAVWRAPIDWGEAWTRIRHANLAFYLLALAVYYLSFVVRGTRWQVLLANAGMKRRTLPLIPIVLTSFFVNCVVPAKLGDVYRAYLGRMKQRLPATKAFGTIVAERLLDLCVLMVLLLLAGAWVFHKNAPGELIPYVVVGGLICAVGIAVIVLMRAGRGTRLLRLLPGGILRRYEQFRSGAVTSLGRWPRLITLTVGVWACESGRLGLVIAALGYSHQVGPSQFVIIALVAALLTTVPFTPGGIGLVEAGMVGVLVAISPGISSTAAVSITLLDRSISYGSLVVLGFITFAVTHIRVSQPAAVLPVDPAGPAANRAESHAVTTSAG
jgi:uncharacterized protein (TIRG00374 family)